MQKYTVLPLGDTTTDTHCGSCPALDYTMDWCGAFSVRLADMDESEVSGYQHRRCEACVVNSLLLRR